MGSSISNERLSYSIGTIGLPRLARALLTLIGSCRIYYVLTESILNPDEWIPMEYARLLELTAGAIT